MGISIKFYFGIGVSVVGVAGHFFYASPLKKLIGQSVYDAETSTLNLINANR